MSIEMEEFLREMRSVYHAKAQRIEAENAKLWNIALEFLSAVSNAELDGSNIKDLKLLGLKQADELKKLTEGN